jgi:predicted peptidase
VRRDRRAALGLMAGAWGLGSCAGPPAPAAEGRWVQRELPWAGRARQHAVYLPPGLDLRRDAARPWPLILFLHGSGERGDDGRRPAEVGLGPAIRRAPQRFPALAVFPQAAPGQQWGGDMLELALAALDQALAEWPVDPRRVLLAGMSMGGHGAWSLAYRAPQRFAALLPICGWVKPMERWPAPVVPAGDGEPLPALARRLATLPTWIVHGERDDVVPASASREAAAALRAAGAAVRYSELPGVNHNSWDPAFASDELVRWLLAQRRA